MALIQCVLAIGVMQVASTFRSPFKEILLFCMCVGVLWGGLLVEQASKPATDGPGPPEGWSWRKEEEKDQKNQKEASTTPISKNKKKRKAAKEGADEEEEEDDEEMIRLQPEVLMLGSAKTGKTLGVALVPGNPGIPHYYCGFGEELQKSFEAEGLDSPTIYCVGYVNFATRAERVTKRQEAGPVSVVEESARIAEVLEELRASHPDGFIILGHSIGAWMVLQHLKSRTADEVPLAVLAMPYLEYRPFSMQPVLALLPPFLARLISLTAAALPSKVKDFLAVPVSRNSRGSFAHDVTAKSFFCQPHQLPAVLELYRTEGPRLDPASSGQGFSECETILSKKDRPRILALYTKGDMWAPMEHSRRLRGLLSEKDEVIDLSADVAVDTKLGAPGHSFVLSREHSKCVAGVVAASLARNTAGPGTRNR
eukprot:s1864_g7.t1